MHGSDPSRSSRSDVDGTHGEIRIQCGAMQKGDESQAGLSHIEACRVRIEELLGGDPFLKRRLERARARQDDYFARRVEAGDIAGKRVRVNSATSGAGEETRPGPTYSC